MSLLDRIRWGILGTGNMARKFAPGLSCNRTYDIGGGSNASSSLFELTTQCQITGTTIDMDFIRFLSPLGAS